jgi:hypothetical protein
VFLGLPARQTLMIIANVDHIALAFGLLATLTKDPRIVATHKAMQICGRGGVGLELSGHRRRKMKVAIAVPVTAGTNIAPLGLVKTEELP